MTRALLYPTTVKFRPKFQAESVTSLTSGFSGAGASYQYFFGLWANRLFSIGDDWPS